MSKDSRIDRWIQFVTMIGILVVLSAGNDNAVAASAATLPGPEEGDQWGPYLEWTVKNPSYSGNPFDLVATVTFLHDASGARHVTEMFYDGDESWKFRFTGTKPGRWSLRTASCHDSDLDGLTGSLTINANPDARGFIAVKGNQWIWRRNGRRFTPQYTLGKAMKYFRKMSDREIDAYIDLFLKEHGFNGLSLLNLELNWFDVEVEGRQSSRQIVDRHGREPDPDIRTFEMLEDVITRVHRGGGGCHLWFAEIYHPRGGYRTSILDPELGGLRGPTSRRLMRYIAARLGPVPGWSMGFGCDLDYQFDKLKLDGAKELKWWYGFLKDHLGWDHVIGARTRGWGMEKPSEINWDGDYVGWEDHRPSYHRYVQCLARFPDKPSMSEDQFRIRDRGRFAFKDYDEEMTRRGLWHATMAGGMAGLWGNMSPHGVPDTPEKVYIMHRYGGRAYPADAKRWTKTHALFIKNRLRDDLTIANDLTDFRSGSEKIDKINNLNCCLKSKDDKHFVFYKENCSSIRMDLSGMAGPQPALAVDTKAAYKEINMGPLSPRDQTWTAPYSSDWAIAIGN